MIRPNLAFLILICVFHVTALSRAYSSTSEVSRTTQPVSQAWAEFLAKNQHRGVLNTNTPTYRALQNYLNRGGFIYGTNADGGSYDASYGFVGIPVTMNGQQRVLWYYPGFPNAKPPRMELLLLGSAQDDTTGSSYSMIRFVNGQMVLVPQGRNEKPRLLSLNNTRDGAQVSLGQEFPALSPLVRQFSLSRNTSLVNMLAQLRGEDTSVPVPPRPSLVSVQDGKTILNWDMIKGHGTPGASFYWGKSGWDAWNVYDAQGNRVGHVYANTQGERVFFHYEANKTFPYTGGTRMDALPKGSVPTLPMATRPADRQGELVHKGEGSTPATLNWGLIGNYGTPNAQWYWGRRGETVTAPDGSRHFGEWTVYNREGKMEGYVFRNSRGVSLFRSFQQAGKASPNDLIFSYSGGRSWDDLPTGTVNSFGRYADRNKISNQWVQDPADVGRYTRIALMQTGPGNYVGVDGTRYRTERESLGDGRYQRVIRPEPPPTPGTRDTPEKPPRGAEPLPPPPPPDKRGSAPGQQLLTQLRAKPIDGNPNLYEYNGDISNYQGDSMYRLTNGNLLSLSRSGSTVYQMGPGGTWQELGTFKDGKWEPKTYATSTDNPPPPSPDDIKKVQEAIIASRSSRGWPPAFKVDDITMLGLLNSPDSQIAALRRLMAAAPNMTHAQSLQYTQALAHILPQWKPADDRLSRLAVSQVLDWVKDHPGYIQRGAIQNMVFRVASGNNDPLTGHIKSELNRVFPDLRKDSGRALGMGDLALHWFEESKRQKTMVPEEIIRILFRTDRPFGPYQSFGTAQPMHKGQLLPPEPPKPEEPRYRGSARHQ